MARFHKALLIFSALIIVCGLFSVARAAQKGSENKGRYYFRQTCKECHT